MKEKWNATDIMFSIITLIFWVLIAAAFVFGLFFDTYRRMFYVPVLIFGFLMNALYAVWHSSRHEKRGFIFIILSMVCLFFIFDYFLRFI